MSKKKGICTYEECELCDQVQEVDETNFVCAKCGHDLMAVPGGGGGGFWKEHGKQVILGAVAVAVLGGGGYGVSTLVGGDEKKNTEKEPIEVKVDSAAVKPDSAAAKPETPAEPEKKVEEIKAEKPISKPKTNPTYGTVNLGYGKYTGDLKNGQPHGHGKIVYTTRHQIVSSKDFIASPGDTFEGDFREGRISSIGYWYHDGNQTAIKP